MMSFQSKVRTMSDLLTTVSQKVYHYRRPVTEAGWNGAILWQEDSEESSFRSDTRDKEQVIHGTIDYFTKQEFDAKVDDIQSVLSASSRVSWRLNSVQYEDDTALIHFEWEFWVW